MILNSIKRFRPRGLVPHFQKHSLSSSTTFPTKKVLKYTALATVALAGTAFLGVFSLSYHISSIFYVREFLSAEEMEQFHSLDQNLVGDELTLLDDRRAKYTNILARYRHYMEPFQESREPHFTVGHVEQLNEFVVQKTVDYTAAMILGDSEERLSALLGFLSVMLTNREMEVVKSKYKHIPIWVEDEGEQKQS